MCRESEYPPYEVELRVGPDGPMYASCSVHGCNSTYGRVVNLGGLEVRLCRTHVKDLDRQLHGSRGLPAGARDSNPATSR